MITIYFEDLKKASSTTIKAENRHLLLTRIATALGSVIKKNVTIHKMEHVSIDGSVTMSLKDQKLNYFTWDNKE